MPKPFGTNTSFHILKKPVDVFTNVKMCVYSLRSLAEAAPSLPPEGGQAPHGSTPHQPPPPNRRTRAVRTGKENICLQEGGGGGGGDGDPYEAFSRTERSKRDRRRPEWNTQRYKHVFRF